MSKTLGWILAIVVVVGIFFYSSYNKLVTSDEVVSTQFAQIETQLQRRFDLIPNLESIVKGSAEFQQDTFTQVTEARSAWAQAKTSGNIERQITAANSFESALSRLLVTVENYPDLDTTAFNNFMTQLEGTENRISVARQRFNEAVQNYNILVRRVPTNIVASIFDFQEQSKFEAIEGTDVAPKVDLSLD